jgi:NAD(P)-dependent dehydrogenase (short-subunit alcohol dehydrogenase family)
MNASPVYCITGGAGAIGLAVAQAASAAGARVALLDVDPVRLAEARATLGGKNDAVLTVPCDATDPSAAAAALAQVITVFGRLDVLVLAAGLTQVGAAVDTSVEVYRRVMAVNFFGVLHLVQPALPHLRAARGSIVILSSVAGFAPLLGRTGYCASKHALHGYANTLRAELREDGVQVLIVSPTFVASDFARRGLAGDGSLLPRERGTSGRLLAPAEVAAAIQRGIRTRKDFLILGGTGRLAWWMWTLLPRVYERMMRRRFERDTRG